MFSDIPVDVWVRHLDTYTRIKFMTISKALLSSFRTVKARCAQILTMEDAVIHKRRLHIFYTLMRHNFVSFYRAMLNINIIHVVCPRTTYLAVSYSFLHRVFDDPDLRILYQARVEAILENYLKYNTLIISTFLTKRVSANDGMHFCSEQFLQIHNYVDLTYRHLLNLGNLDPGQNGYTALTQKVAVILCHIYNIMYELPYRNNDFLRHSTNLTQSIMMDQQELLMLSSHTCC